jgi:hypothetical protein
MDLFRDPGTYVFVHWRRTSTSTKIEPHGVADVRAVIGRYVGSRVVYYYGGYANNPFTSGTERSYVSSTNGSNAGWYYSSRGVSGVFNLYDDYSRLRCKL